MMIECVPYSLHLVGHVECTCTHVWTQYLLVLVVCWGSICMAVVLKRVVWGVVWKTETMAVVLFVPQLQLKTSEANRWAVCG